MSHTVFINTIIKTLIVTIKLLIQYQNIGQHSKVFFLHGQSLLTRQLFSQLSILEELRVGRIF